MTKDGYCVTDTILCFSGSRVVWDIQLITVSSHKRTDILNKDFSLSILNSAIQGDASFPLNLYSSVYF